MRIAILFFLFWACGLQADLPTYFFKREKHLEKEASTSGDHCLETFLEKGGSFHSLPADEPSFTILAGDAVYPICSGGWNRSQTLYALLEPYQGDIVLFPPHGARFGWDPLNGQIFRFRNLAGEARKDEFFLTFKRERIQRLGFELDEIWKPIESDPTPDGLAAITRYYDEHLYGPESALNGKKGSRRVYIAFTANTHVILNRLNQTNDSLENVHVVSINMEDLASNPPEDLQTYPLSQKSYAHLFELLQNLVKVSQ